MTPFRADLAAAAAKIDTLLLHSADRHLMHLRGLIKAAWEYALDMERAEAPKDQTCPRCGTDQALSEWEAREEG